MIMEGMTAGEGPMIEEENETSKVVKGKIRFDSATFNVQRSFPVQLSAAQENSIQPTEF